MIEWCFVKRFCLFDPRHCFSTAPIWTEDRANFLSPNHTHPIKILSSAPFLTIPQRRWCDSLREEVMRPNLAVVGALPRDELRAGLIRRRSLAPRPWVLRGVDRGAR